MKLIKEIKRQDYSSADTERHYQIRLAARAIVWNDSNEIALLYVSANG